MGPLTPFQLARGAGSKTVKTMNNLVPTQYYLALYNSIQAFSLTDEKVVINKLNFVITLNILCKRRQHYNFGSFICLLSRNRILGMSRNSFFDYRYDQINGNHFHLVRVERKLKLTQERTKRETIVSMSFLRILTFNQKKTTNIKYRIYKDSRRLIILTP